MNKRHYLYRLLGSQGLKLGQQLAGVVVDALITVTLVQRSGIKGDSQLSGLGFVVQWLFVATRKHGGDGRCQSRNIVIPTSVSERAPSSAREQDGGTLCFFGVGKAQGPSRL